MKKVISIMLAVVLALSVMCSFSFAAEVPEEESDDLMVSVTLCENCFSSNVTIIDYQREVWDRTEIVVNSDLTATVYQVYKLYRDLYCNDCGKYFSLYLGEKYVED
ncbi:MAG: hypothetical protein LUF29_04580 [Oscillospiraceae bacterium]|nr:hypothetical protein [Oscillospiraceae bacterium]